MIGETTNLTGLSRLYLSFLFPVLRVQLVKIASSKQMNKTSCSLRLRTVVLVSLPFWPRGMLSSIRAIRSFERRLPVMGPAALLLRLLLTSYAMTLDGIVVFVT